MAEGYGRLQPIMTRFWLELSFLKNEPEFGDTHHGSSSVF